MDVTTLLAALAFVMAVLVGVWFLLQRQAATELAARTPGLPAPKPKSCQSCHHWSHPEGQEVLRRHPAFWQAAQHLSPNDMQRTALDGDGNANADRKPLPMSEDKWAYMGACLGHGELRHRVDRCPYYLSATSRKARAISPGEGDFPAVVSPPETYEDTESGLVIGEVDGKAG